MDTKKASLTTCQKFHNKKLTILRSGSEKKRKIAHFAENFYSSKYFLYGLVKGRFSNPAGKSRQNDENSSNNVQ